MNIRICVFECLLIMLSFCCLVPSGLGQDAVVPTPALASEFIAAPKKQPSPEKILTNYAETGGQYLFLTNGFGTWDSGYVRSVFSRGNDTLNGEVEGQREFADSGIYFAIGDTHNFSPNTFASLTVGSSAGGFFLPHYRADAFISQKWLVRKQLITAIGLGYCAAKDPHRDWNLSLGTTYYFEKPWILENGLRFNISNPGAILSPSGFVALTQGKNKQHYITARFGYGEEAYQLIGPTNALSSFRSQTVTLTWRKWIGSNWGTNGVADYYANPYYSRAGGSFGIFREF
jgi:YaiO family outer membrane protein